MNLALVLPMSAFALAASISPGPVNLVCLSSGTRYGMRRGLSFVSGATVGFLVLFLAVGFGLNAVLVRLPALAEGLRWAGAAFLLYLAWRLACDSGDLGDGDRGGAPGFTTGALMQWLNPKAWLAAASGIGAYTNAAAFGEVVLFAALYGPICWLSLGCWVYAGAFLRSHVRRPRVMRRVNRGLAVLLAGSCLFLLVD